MVAEPDCFVNASDRAANRGTPSLRKIPSSRPPTGAAAHLGPCLPFSPTLSLESRRYPLLRHRKTHLALPAGRQPRGRSAESGFFFIFTLFPSAEYPLAS
jgi:hypothetical protein